MESNKQYAKVTEFDGVPKAGELLPLAFQHVVAMIVGCVTPAIILCGGDHHFVDFSEHDPSEG